MNEYQNAVEKFKTLQPDAVIYVQAIMHVTQKKSDSDPIFNNPGIDAKKSAHTAACGWCSCVLY